MKYPPMPRWVNFLAVLVCAAMLGACAGNSVRVSYPRPENDVQARRIKALGSVYLLIGKPRRMEKDQLLQRQLEKELKKIPVLGRRLFDVDAGAFAEALNDALGKIGGSILATRVVDDVSKEHLVDRLQPTGVLIVRFETLDVRRDKTEKEITVKDKNGTQTKQTAVSWKYTAQLSLRARLINYPGREFLIEGPIESTVSETLKEAARVPDAKTGKIPESRLPNEEEWSEKVIKNLLKQAAQKLPSLFGTIPSVHRTRTIFVDKKDPASKEAASRAGSGRWEEASELWVERLGGADGSWREEVNLAVAAEKRRLFPEAERIYKQARSSAGSDPEAAKIKWDEIVVDLQQAVATMGGRSDGALAWFGAPLAVLPFSDDSTSVQGPEMLRDMIHQALRRGGYNVIALDEVDRSLRRHGYSQGGQLTRVEPEEISRWLNGAKLFYGNISDFRNIMLGVYKKRIVAGDLKIWDPGAKDFTWSAQETAVREKFTTNASEAGAALGGQLMRGLFELWIRKPLSTESALFVRQNLETYPLRPNQR